MNVQVFIKSILSYCIPSVFSALIGIGAIPIISAFYPAEDYGKINLFYSVGNMLTYIVLIGLDSAYIRFYFEPPGNFTSQKICSVALITSGINSILLLLFGYCFSDYVSQTMFGERDSYLIFVLFIYIIGLVMFRLLSIDTRMRKQVFMFNVQQLLLIFTNRVSFVLLAIFSANYKYSIMSIAFSTLLFGCLFLLIQKDSLDFVYDRCTKEDFLVLYKFAFPLMPSMLMVWLNNSIPKIILSGFNAYDVIGVLSIATSLSNVFSLIPSAFGVYWSPFMYSNYRIKQNFICKVHNYIVILSFFIVLLIFTLQDCLYYFVNGNYKVSQQYFMLIMLAPIQSLLCETTGYGINLSNKTVYSLYISIISVILNALATLFLYKFIGFWGAIVAISGSAIFQMFFRTLIGQKYYKSIECWNKTIIGFITILLICVSNIWAYDDFFYRGISALLCTIIIIFIYIDDFKILLSYINSLFFRSE